MKRDDHIDLEKLGPGWQFIHQSPSAILITDALAADHPIVYVNAAFEKETGYSRAEVLGRNPRFFQNGHRDQPALDVVRQAMSTYTDCHVVVKNYRKNGELFWNELRLTPIRDADGQITHYLGVQNDITTQIREQDAHQALIENSIQGIVIVQDGQPVFVNKAMEAMTGYSREEYLAMSQEQQLETIHPEDRDAILTDYNQCMNGEPVERQFYRCLRKDGSVWWCHLHTSLLEYQGRPALQSIFIDVTEQKQAEVALRKSEERYRLITENIQDMIALHKPDGTPIYLSPSFERILGYTAEELLATLSERVHPDDLQCTSEYHQRALESDNLPPLEYRMLTKQGDVLWFSTATERILDDQGHLKHLLAVSKNITRRKLAELALREREELYRLLTENSQDMITLHDPNGDISFANPTVEKVFGLSTEEMKLVPPLDGIHPDDLQRVAEHRRGFIAGEAVEPRLEYRVYTHNGDVIWVESRINALKNDAGQVEHILTIGRDITERKEAEQALRRSEQHHRHVVENIPGVVYELRREPNGALSVTYVSDNFEELVGVPLHKASASIDRYILSLDEQALRAVENKLVQSAQNLTTYEDERELPHPTQGTIWIQARATPNRQPDGSTVWTGIAVDITQRKRAEQALRQSENETRALLQAMPDLILHSDRDGTFLDYHAPDPSMLLMPPEDFIGRKAEDVLPSFLANNHSHFVQAALETGETQHYEYTLTIDDTPRYFEARMARSMPDEVLTLVRDITQRKRIEQENRRSEERLRTIINNIPIMISFYDEEGRLEFANAHSDEVLGWTAEELLHLEDPLTYFYPDPDLRRQVREFMNDPSTEWRDFQAHTKHNGIRTTSWTNVRLSDNRSIGIGMDVTDLRQAQQREMEFRVEKERRQLMEQFIEDAAHEFRTPLSIINSSVHLMAASADKQRRADRADVISLQVERISKLVDMLTLMIQLGGDVAAQRTPTDVSQLAESACLQVVGCEPHFRGLSEPSSVMLDPALMTQALRQLIDNACRFTQGAVTVTVTEDNDHLHIHIQDEGPGLDEAALPHAFDTFWRQDGAHTTPGFGLGLPIAQRIVELHGGQIDLSSTVADGTTVTVLLPTQ